MFQEKSLVFFYAISPIHMGSGTSLGVIDNPIQRERHTSHPVMAGSGIKGSGRETSKELGMEDIDVVFGPDTSGAEHAGAVSFSDGQILAFPVRSLRHGFVYAVSPITVGRFLRMAEAAGIDVSDYEVPSVPDDEHAMVLDQDLLSDGKLVLESYEFTPMENGDETKIFTEMAEWIAESVFGNESSMDFFKKKLKKHLVLISDTQFSYFVTNSTVVEPHVRINDDTGTADDGGLFFTENVPPEAIFVSLLMASQQRKKKGEGGAYMSAEDVMKKVVNTLNGRLMQVGGDATTGRGQVLVRFVTGNNTVDKEG